MRTFEVFLNKKRLCVAGIDQDCVLTAMVDYVTRDEDRLELTVGGLNCSTNEHVRWSNRRLRVGDEICILIGERKSADRPTKRFPSNPAKDLEARKNYVREMAKKLGWELREL